MKLRTIMLIAGLATSFAARSQELSQHFYDAGTGVSFRYPSTWQFNSQLKDYLGSAFQTTAGDPPQIVAQVGVSGIPKTNVGPIVFRFASLHTENKKSCLDRAGTGQVPDQPPHWSMIGGVRFWSVKSGDAGMSHWADENVYALYQPDKEESGGRCLLFEEHLSGIADNTLDNARNATRAEIAAEQRKLDAVMQSVRIHPVEP